MAFQATTPATTRQWWKWWLVAMIIIILVFAFFIVKKVREAMFAGKDIIDGLEASGNLASVGGVVIGIMTVILAVLIYKRQEDSTRRALNELKHGPLEQPEKIVGALKLWIEKRQLKQIVYVSQFSQIPAFWHHNESFCDELVRLVTNPSNRGILPKIWLIGPNKEEFGEYAKQVAEYAKSSPDNSIRVWWKQEDVILSHYGAFKVSLEDVKRVSGNNNVVVGCYEGSSQIPISGLVFCELQEANKDGCTCEVMYFYQKASELRTGKPLPIRDVEIRHLSDFGAFSLAKAVVAGILQKQGITLEGV